MDIAPNVLRSRLKRLIVLQRTTIRNYERIGKITTDEALKSLVSTFSKRHESTNLRILSKVDLVKIFDDPVSKVRNYVKSRWKNIVTNLIIDNQKNLLEHLWQAEIKILQEVTTLLSALNQDKEIRPTLIACEQATYKNLDQLDNIIRQLKSGRNHSMNKVA